MRSEHRTPYGEDIIVVGYGPGISTGVAEKFGAEGFQVSLVARNKERLDAGVKALEAKGVKAASSRRVRRPPSSSRGADWAASIRTSTPSR